MNEAVAWYAAQAPGLELKFVAEIETASRRIAEYPHAWHPLGDGIRRYRLSRFPYELIYVAEGNDLIVLAVAHLHREPSYWRSRMAERSS